MKRSKFALTAAALGMIAAAWPLAVHAQVEKNHITIGTASLGVTYLPLIVGEHQGYFKKEGVDVEIAAFAGGSKALEALMGGSIDVASGAYSNTLTMAAKGQKLVAFANQVRCPGFSLVVGTKSKKPFQSLKDLKGMRIGVSAPGSSSHMVLDYLLQQGGLSDADVSVIGVGSSAGAIAAVSSGQIDAMLGNEPIDTMLVGTKDATIFTNMRSAPESDKVFGGVYPEASFYSTASFIAKNPKTVQALANAVVKVERWLQTATADQVAAAVPEEQLLNNKPLFIEAFNNMRSCLSPDGVIAQPAAQTVLRILSAFDTDVRDAKIPLEQTYDNHFVQNAAAATN